ncbi:MAG: hypothetical protein SPK50_06390 [Mobiluncus porci]|uniref:Uncharacterized protein n=1 Tax=Mobiluncus porci TaxID=2652278 RepID=A0A7K0K1S5_9ACTO|nr:hypothetical protein [Mobiluncus porci]MDD7540616.1 hypothetical protein [Mobiluncus porci]MDY5748741.1 hypothetical protein [Mobiluncus porci]MST49010.1 hypothetical protein [Mobiluncus porci]
MSTELKPNLDALLDMELENPPVPDVSKLSPAELRAELQKGRDDFAAGRYSTWEEFVKELDDERRSRRA